ncbi:MAG: hypothetical protein IKV19_00400 [Bacteroidaceae bacterium]|nr:hypothetical protein [Bacteroidaceae bacterium]
MKITGRQKLQIAGAILLLLCFLPLPYGFYTIVRVAMAIMGAYFASDYFVKDKKELAITFVVVAVLFQPFFKLALGREIWLIVDVAVAILLLVLALRRK